MDVRIPKPASNKKRVQANLSGFFTKSAPAAKKQKRKGCSTSCGLLAAATNPAEEDSKPPAEEESKRGSDPVDGAPGISYSIDFNAYLFAAFF